MDLGVGAGDGASGDADFVGKVAWSGELGFGVKEPERGIASYDEAEDEEPAEDEPEAHDDARRRGPPLMVDLLVFVLAAAAILGGAVVVIAARVPVHSALGLVASLFGVAVLFVDLDAHFLAAVQIIVYAGAIVVLFLFVIMLLGVDKADDLAIDPLGGQRPLAAVAGVGLLGVALAALFLTESAVDTVVTGAKSLAGPLVGDDVTVLGEALFTDYLFAFEATSVLLVIAVVGAVVLARTPRNPDPAPRGRGMTLAVVEVTTTWYLVLASVLFTLGAVGLLVRRNPLVMFMCVELMLNAVNLTFVAFASPAALNDVGGQAAVFFVLVVAAAEVVVGLGIIVALLRRKPGATADDVAVLKG